MADGGDGFVGRCEVVEPRRRNLRWPDDLKAWIVAESFQPGARVVDVALRHGMVAHQLSDGRRFARQGLLRLPTEVLPAFLSAMGLPVDVAAEPAFVALAIVPEPRGLADSPCVPQVAEVATVATVATVIVPAGMMMVEIGWEIVLRVPCDVAVERAAAFGRVSVNRFHILQL